MTVTVCASLMVTGIATVSTAAPAVVTSASISSGTLMATVDTAFPQVLQYQYGTGTLNGNTGATPQVLINGTAYTPTVTSTSAATHVDYVLTFSSINVTINVTISVSGSVLDWKVTGVTENGTTKVSTLAIPGQGLLSVRGDQAGAQLADASVLATDYAPGDPLDTISAVSALTADTQARHKSIALVATSAVAAGVVSNSLTTYGDPVQTDRGGNLLVQTTTTSGVNTTAIGSDVWTYRGPDNAVVALPEEKVVLTGDANGTGTVDWQDAAIAYRQIMTEPKQAAETKNNVVSQIALNFESQAQNPFAKTLDDIKKVALYTDGLGQSVELKGYQDEGHDASHPDYAGHYNTGAGGLADINTVVNGAAAYNAIVGVHISDVGEAPRAHAFRWDKASSITGPYIYGDTSYSLDTTKDLSSGDYASRISALVTDVPNLGFVYDDAFFGVNWNAFKNADVVAQHNLPIYTEFPTYMFPYVSWYHDSNEYNDVGINSQILRFVYNQDMDGWIQNSQPMLGGEQNNASFMGWHSSNSVNTEIAQVFTNNLPTKYLQNFTISKWDTAANTITFTNGVSTAMNTATNTPQIWRDGALERDGNKIFLPWSPQGQEKIYAYDDVAESRTWTLPSAWSGQTSVTLYQLTDTGKSAGMTLPVSGHAVTLNLAANTPYVIYPGTPVAVSTSGQYSDGSNNNAPVLRADTATSVGFGSGTVLKDGEFFTRSLANWPASSTSGNVSGISVATDANGFQNLQITGANDGQVSQTLTGLTPGQTYSASAYVSVTGNRQATIQVDGIGASVVSNSITKPPPPQNDVDNRLHGQNFQRLEVLFTEPAGSTTATLHLMGAADSNTADKVLWTDVRVMTDTGGGHQTGGHFYTEDFEHNTGGGFGPFLIGQSSEPSEILSELNSGYTRDTISGNYSLETIKNTAGLQFRTWPGSIKFVAGHSYRVQLDYQADVASTYRFQIDADGTGSPITDIGLAQTTTRGLTSPPPAGTSPTGWTDSLPPQYSAPSNHIDTSFTAGNCGDAYLALTQTGASTGAATLDNLVIDDLGTGAGGLPTCGNRIPQSSMSVKYADSQETSAENAPATNVLDGNAATYWVTKWSGTAAPLPHEIQLDLGGTYKVTDLYYLPRQDSANGRIGNYQVYLSSDGTNWGTAVASGTFPNTTTEQDVHFAAASARYVRLVALTEVNGQPWTSIAELNVAGS
jgi:endo-alpha-N-acetylgalactosaminidase